VQFLQDVVSQILLPFVNANDVVIGSTIPSPAPLSSVVKDGDDTSSCSVEQFGHLIIIKDVVERFCPTDEAPFGSRRLAVCSAMPSLL
jgi:hypothetical protein